MDGSVDGAAEGAWDGGDMGASVRHLDGQMDEPLQDSIRTGPFTEWELKQAIKFMQNDKSEGPDGIAVEVDKYAAGDEALSTLLRKYNKILTTGDVPGCSYHGTT